MSRSCLPAVLWFSMWRRRCKFELVTRCPVPRARGEKSNAVYATEPPQLRRLDGVEGRKKSLGALRTCS